MYKKGTNLVSSIENLGNYINGFDVYNSLFMCYLNDPSLVREQYTITVYEYRPDLIARDFYGSDNYMGILLIQNPINLTEYYKGQVLNLLPKATVDSILKLM